VSGDSFVGKFELSLSHTTSAAAAVSFKLGVTNATQAAVTEVPVTVPKPTAKPSQAKPRQIDWLCRLRSLVFVGVYAVVHTR
jgi:hypothetical protein